jgi:hypothetical protein
MDVIGKDGKLKCGRSCNGMRVTGCFDLLTNITVMKNGVPEQTPAFLVNEGDLVWNPLLGRGQKVIRKVAGPELNPLLKVSIEGHSVTVSDRHVFWTKEGMKLANELTVHDVLKNTEGEWKQITSITQERREGQTFVVNFSLETEDDAPEEHFVDSAGIVSGDLTIQEQMGSGREDAPDWLRQLLRK